MTLLSVANTCQMLWGNAIVLIEKHCYINCFETRSCSTQHWGDHTPLPPVSAIVCFFQKKESVGSLDPFWFTLIRLSDCQTIYHCFAFWQFLWSEPDENIWKFRFYMPLEDTSSFEICILFGMFKMATLQSKSTSIRPPFEGTKTDCFPSVFMLKRSQCEREAWMHQRRTTTIMSEALAFTWIQFSVCKRIQRFKQIWFDLPCAQRKLLIS